MTCLDEGSSTLVGALGFSILLSPLTETEGFEVGVGPGGVVDQGMGKSATTITAQYDIHAFIFGQKGFMAGLGVQGNKITRLVK